MGSKTSAPTNPRQSAAPNTARGVGAAVPAAAGVLVTIAVWWLLTSGLHLVHPAVLAPPQAVLAAFLAASGRLLPAVWQTTWETIVGFLLSALVGFLIGLLLSSSRVAERMFSPLLVALNAVPKIVVAPLLVVTLGWGARPILTMVFLLCFFPIVLSTATGLAATPADLVELARSLDANRWQTFRKVRLPNALPQIFVGLKVAMPLAAIGAVIGEFQTGESGIGYEIVQSFGVGEVAIGWAAVILISLISIVLYFALVLIERLALPWVRETTAAR